MTYLIRFALPFAQAARRSTRDTCVGCQAPPEREVKPSPFRTVAMVSEVGLDFAGVRMRSIDGLLVLVLWVLAIRLAALAVARSGSLTFTGTSELRDRHRAVVLRDCAEYLTHEYAGRFVSIGQARQR